ncbi:MAG: RDD family protein [Nakamurella sp.]
MSGSAKPLRTPRRFTWVLPVRRLLAWGIDSVMLAAWVGVIAAVGIPLHHAGVTRSLRPLAINLVGAICVVLPGTLALAFAESRPAGRTPGKKVFGLAVRDARSGGRLLAGPAVTRNALKVGLPWLIAHAIVIEATSPDPPPPTVLIGAYVLPVIWVGSLFLGPGRTPYDRAAAAVVIAP